MANSRSYPPKRTTIDLTSNDESDQIDQPSPKRRAFFSDTSSNTGSEGQQTATDCDEDDQFQETVPGPDANEQYREDLHDFTTIYDEDNSSSNDINDADHDDQSSIDEYISDHNGENTVLQESLPDHGIGSFGGDLDEDEDVIGDCDDYGNKDDTDDDASSEMHVDHLDFENPELRDSIPTEGSFVHQNDNDNYFGDSEHGNNLENDEPDNEDEFSEDGDDSTEHKDSRAASVASMSSDSTWEGFSPDPPGPQLDNSAPQTPTSEASVQEFHDAMESQQGPTGVSPAPSSTVTLDSCPSDSVSDGSDGGDATDQAAIDQAAKAEDNRSVRDAESAGQPLNMINGEFNDLFSITFGPRDDAKEDEDDSHFARPVIDNDADGLNTPSTAMDDANLSELSNSLKLASPCRRRLVDTTKTTTTTVAFNDDSPKPASATTNSEDPPRLSLAFRQHRQLQLRVVKLINEIPWVFKAGFEWPARRYWIAVIPAGKAASERMMPSPNGTMVLKTVLSFSIKDVIWMQGNKYTTLRTISNAFYSRTLLGDGDGDGLETQKQKGGGFFLLGGVEKVSDLGTNCQAMDIMGDKVVVLVACNKQERAGRFRDRELLEGLIPMERQVIDLT